MSNKSNPNLREASMARGAYYKEREAYYSLWEKTIIGRPQDPPQTLLGEDLPMDVGEMLDLV